MEEKKKIGELLVESGVVSASQLQKALDEQQKYGGRLCYNLIRLGYLRADDLLGFLREQFGVAAVNLDRFQIEDSVLNLIPPNFARRHRVIPLHVLDQTLTVAMVDPARQDDIRDIQEMTGLKVDPIISPESSLETALSQYYGPWSEEEAPPSADGVLSLGEERDERHLYLSAPPPGGYSPDDWLRRFFLQAIKRRSREIHLEPVENGLRARFRISGRLQGGEMAPEEVRHVIIRRALALAKIDTFDSMKRPMEGRFRMYVRNRWLRAIISSFPTLYGERLVIKVMDESILCRDFQELGMSKEIADEAHRILNFRHGMFLINAPPNQGKTTTFYSFLCYLREEGGRNVMTLESPVRFPLEGVSQSQISPRGGLDFYSGLESLLSQEPDIVGLTKIPDKKSLELVFEASRQCLVIGLCGFWDNLQVLEWIRSSGISPVTQGLLIRGLLAQRLLPRICNHCRETITETIHLLEGIRDKRPEELVFYTGSGCERCGSTGKAGRLGLFELLSFRGELVDLLARGTALQVIYEEAQRQGMRILQEDGIMKATQGLVDIREVIEATISGGGEG